MTRPMGLEAPVDLTGFVPVPEAEALGWGDRAVLQGLIRDEAPGARVVIELGCWKGQGTCWLAEAAPAATLYCVDTWLGSHEHWTRPDEGVWDLHRVAGYPRLYDRWLTTVQRAGLVDRVRPIPLPSLQAARLMADALPAVRADVIVVDASHDGWDVQCDLQAWTPRMAPGGLWIGDDYSQSAFPGVRLAVEAWAATRGLTVRTRGRYWWAREPEVPA